MIFQTIITQFTKKFQFGNPIHFVPSLEENEIFMFNIQSSNISFSRLSKSHPFPPNLDSSIFFSLFRYSKTVDILCSSGSFLLSMQPNDCCVSVFIDSCKELSIKSCVSLFISNFKVKIFKIFTEQLKVNELFVSMGFHHIACQVSKSGTIHSLYALEDEMRHIRISEDVKRESNLHFLKMFNFQHLQEEIEKMKNLELIDLDKSSNIKESWKMLALRSFDGNSKSLSFPNEDNSRSNKFSSEFFWTDLAIHFPLVKKLILSQWDENIISRVRFSVLERNGSISRHADKPNKSDRMIPRKRYHLVFHSNDKCFVNSVNCKGLVNSVNMKVGELWEINNVFPHWVENNGNTERIHLLIDTFDIL